MNFVHLAPGVGSTRGLVVALGTFDGVHVGHRAIVAAAKKESTVLGTDTAVLIFSASPQGAGCILPLDDRLREFRALGVNLAVVCDFDELRALTPEAFFSEILLDKLGAYEPLVDALRQKGRALVLIGEAADRIEAAARGLLPIARVSSMVEAVHVARRFAKPGDAVLLSPACASFDMFRDYKDRGDQFAQAVQSMLEVGS